MIRLVAILLALATSGATHAAEFVPSRAMPLVFAVQDKGGRIHASDRFRARRTLLHFWASWCLPCRLELPALESLQADMRAEGVAVVAVSVDRLGWDVIDRTARELGLHDLDLFHDRDSEAARALGVDALPTTILMDADGREIARMRGQGDWRDVALRSAILSLHAQ